jgi:hypothetical protein
LKLARNSSGRERVKGDREDCRVDDLVAGLPVKEMRAKNFAGWFWTLAVIQTTIIPPLPPPRTSCWRPRRSCSSATGSGTQLPRMRVGDLVVRFCLGGQVMKIKPSKMARWMVVM